MDAHFPESMHASILAAIGLDLAPEPAVTEKDGHCIEVCVGTVTPSTGPAHTFCVKGVLRSLEHPFGISEMAAQ